MVTGVSGPVSAARGDTISVSTTVENVLPTAAGPFNVGIYLSSDPVITTADTLLGNRLVAGLSGNGTDTALTNVTIPLALYASSPAGYTYRKAITIDGTKVSGSLSDFPVLVSLTDPALKTVAHGGRVQNANGYDMIFTAGDGGTLLNHEVEQYDAATGQLLAWVKVPNLSAGINTTLYVYYGNNAISTSQENKSAVWDSGYHMVQHLNETSGTHFDSTANANNAAPFGSPNQNVTGKIGGADSFDGVNDYVIVDAPSGGAWSGDYSVELWVKSPTASPSAGWAGIFNNYKNFGVGGTTDSFQIDLGEDVPGTYKMGIYGRYAYGMATMTAAWQHLAVTLSGTTLKVYNNGVNTGTYTIPNGYSRVFRDYLMGVNRKGDTFFNGQVDEVRVSKNTVRSPAWIATGYNNQNAPSSFYSVGAEEVSPFPVPVYYLGTIADYLGEVTELNENNNAKVQLSASGVAQGSAVSVLVAPGGGNQVVAGGGGGVFADMLWLLLGWRAVRRCRRRQGESK